MLHFGESQRTKERDFQGTGFLIAMGFKDSQFCTQQLKCAILVFQLGSLFGAEDTDPGWFVEKVNRRLDLVDILPCMGQKLVDMIPLERTALGILELSTADYPVQTSCAAGPCCRKFNVLGINHYFNFICLK